MSGAAGLQIAGWGSRGLPWLLALSKQPGAGSCPAPLKLREGGGSPWQSPTEPPESWRAAGAVRGHWEARVWEAALGPGGLPLSAHLRIGLTSR